MPTSRTARLSTGFEVPLDGDLLAIIEALYKEVTLGNVLNSSFETMRTEILAVIDQMTSEERRDYFAESLFLNSVTYENELLSAYVRRLAVKPKKAAPAVRSAAKVVKKALKVKRTKTVTKATRTAARGARKPTKNRSRSKKSR